MEFKVRPLNYGDIAPMTQIISKVGVREFAGVFSTQSVVAMMGGATDKSQKVQRVSLAMMFEIAGILLSNFDKASDEIADFLASVAGMTPEEVKALSLADTYDLVQTVLTAQDFKDFFTRVSASLQRGEA